MSHKSKQISKICNKSISNKNYEKWRIFLSNIKELDQIVHLNDHFTLKKGTFFDKRALGQSRRTDGHQIPHNQKIFLISIIYIKKNDFFFNFNEASDPQMLYLSKIGPASCNDQINELSLTFIFWLLFV